MPNDCLVHQRPHRETLTAAQAEALCKMLRQARACLLAARDGGPLTGDSHSRGGDRTPREWMCAADEQLAYAQKILHMEAEG